jgi:flotillin
MNKTINEINNNVNLSLKQQIMIGGVIGLGSFATFIVFRYKTSKSHQWLVRTGLGIKDIQISKKFMHWPFQNIQTIDMIPTSYKFSINAMSKEKMEFNFPAVFTIGPRNDTNSLIKYSRFLLEQHITSINNLITGIIEGETRAVSANLSIEDIFTGRNIFKNDVVANIKVQLEQYGLEIYNANIEELKDSTTSNYFKSLSQKIKAEAENKAKVDVSEQNKKGNIGQKEREAETRQRTIIIEAETALIENSKNQEIIKSKAELEKIRAEQDLIIKQALIKSEQESEVLKMQLMKDVEIKRSDMELEKQRALDLTKTKVSAEMQIKNAEADAQSIKLKAEALLYAKQKEAEGTTAMYNAQSEGLEKLVKSFNGDARALLSYTMMDRGIYEKLADSNAKAINDMKPKITVWTNDAKNSMDTIQNLSKSVVPLMDTIKDQTGYSLPEWLIKNQTPSS